MSEDKCGGGGQHARLLLCRVCEHVQHRQAAHVMAESGLCK